mgnify:CR=1 FL=1
MHGGFTIDGKLIEAILINTKDLEYIYTNQVLEKFTENVKK